jgi:hypothetical protein
MRGCSRRRRDVARTGVGSGRSARRRAGRSRVPRRSCGAGGPSAGPPAPGSADPSAKSWAVAALFGAEQVRAWREPSPAAQPSIAHCTIHPAPGCPGKADSLSPLILRCGGWGAAALTDLRRRRLQYRQLQRLFSRCMSGESPAEPSSARNYAPRYNAQPGHTHPRASRADAVT